MPHLRNRFAATMLKKLAKLWPVVGIIGPRQSGKSTLVRECLAPVETLSLDDLEARQEAQASPKTFLGKLKCPVVFDEVQKAPALFDAIKLKVDLKRIPGSYFLTGSSSFSSKIGIRESLTGRIGLLHLFPMNLAELHQKEFRAIKHLDQPLPTEGKPRFGIVDVAEALARGGMPIPAFLRNEEERHTYWSAWLETTLLRDLVPFIKRGYDSDFAYSLLKRMGAVLRDGELPTLKHFPQNARKVRTYLDAMQEIFLVRKINCHPDGIGKEIWLFMDSGFAAYIMGSTNGEGTSLSLARHFLWNEWATQAEYQPHPRLRLERIYYKTAQGSPIDIISEDVPMRVVSSIAAVTRQRDWEERPLRGFMKKTGSKKGYLIAPVDFVEHPGKKGGIGILPWSAWS